MVYPSQDKYAEAICHQFISMWFYAKKNLPPINFSRFHKSIKNQEKEIPGYKLGVQNMGITHILLEFKLCIIQFPKVDKRMNLKKWKSMGVFAHNVF